MTPDQRKSDAGKKEKALNNRNRKLETASPEMETDSQRENRRGGGRKKSGSDGSSNNGRGSNH